MVRKVKQRHHIYPLTFHALKPDIKVAATPQVAPTIKKATWAAVFVFAVCLLLVSAAAQAQPSTILLSPQADELYSQLLDNPTDRSLNLRYSAMMSKAGDYEAAIPPLERLLVSEPTNSWLKLQLGTLYNALNSSIMAAAYLNEVVSDPLADAETISKAQQLLANM